MTSDVIKSFWLFFFWVESCVLYCFGVWFTPPYVPTHRRMHSAWQQLLRLHRFDEHKGVPTWLASRRKRCCPDVSVRHRFGRTSPNVRHFDAARQPMQIRKHDTNLLRLIVYRIDCRDTPRPIMTSSYQNCTRQHK